MTDDLLEGISNLGIAHTQLKMEHMELKAKSAKLVEAIECFRYEDSCFCDNDLPNTVECSDECIKVNKALKELGEVDE